MGKYSKTEIRESTNKPLWAHCRKCDDETSHAILSEIYVTDFIPGPDINIWENYYILQCNGCKSISFYIDSKNSEDDYYNEEKQCMMPTSYIEYYPKSKKGIKELEDVYLLPFGIRNIYNETLSAIYNNLPILTGIGIRAIIEAVAKDHSINDKGIQLKINKLIEKGLITKESEDILLTVKEIGNSAAHDMTIYDFEKLSSAFYVVENLIKNLYIIPKLAEIIKKNIK